jgi:hypothetical protein
MVLVYLKDIRRNVTKKVTKFLQNTEPVWSKHNSAQGEGTLSMILQGLGNFLLSILLEVKNQCQWHMTHFYEEFVRESFHPQYKRSYWL